MFCRSFVTCSDVHICLVVIHICTLDFADYRNHSLCLVHLPNIFSRIFLPGWLVRVTSLHVFDWYMNFHPSYGPFASSALAGQGLASKFHFSISSIRTLFIVSLDSGCLCAAVFPLFTSQMYQALGYRWANTLFGCLAAIMAPISFVRSRHF